MRQAGTFVSMKSGESIDITAEVRNVNEGDMCAWLNKHYPGWVRATTVHTHKPLPEYSFAEAMRGSDRLLKDEVERLRRERRE